MSCSVCSKYPTWTCYCGKDLCDNHKDMRNHRCEECNYCKRNSNGYCSLCYNNLCSPYCDEHLKNCKGTNINSYDKPTSCPLCVNGRIITGYGTSERCYLCFGNC